MSLVHPTMVQQCELMVKKSLGPYTVFRPEEGKTPLQYLGEAFAPLKEFSSKIAFVIDGSTTRGFAEPSQAALYAQHLGLFSANAFDVSEACNGFARALHLAYLLFQSTPGLQDKYILLINNEQPIPERAVVPKNPFDYAECISYYVGLSFSNVFTCTLLRASENRSWTFFHKTETIYASHISIGLPFIADGYLPQNKEYTVTTNNQYGQFCLPRFHQNDRIQSNFRKFTDKRREFMKTTNLICHTFSKSVWLYGTDCFDKKELVLYYDVAGNLGSCSLPYILHHKFKGQIPQGERFTYFGVAAGGSLLCLEFEHAQKTAPAGQSASTIVDIDHDEVEKYAQSKLAKPKL